MSQHNAPSVTYPLGRSYWEAWVLSALLLMAVLLIGGWVLASQHAPWQQGIVVALLIWAGLAAYQGWSRAPVGQLVWDGQAWRWESQGYQAGVAEYELSVVLDFQVVMLLRLENQAHAKMWLWPERRGFAARWLDLRRAVYSPRRELHAAANPSAVNPS